ncbi:MAG: transposase [Lachnospiraceae bacterium]|nr:transposase [Lachnospiraceae bacterium]
MPRNARKKSATGVYHVVTRGIGKQLLFEDDNDYYYFLRIMYKYKIEQGSKIYCYCLMDNHVHLLIYDSNGSIDQLMKKVGVSYAAYYNHKYDRIGTLFQDRFKSEPVEDERYFRTVFRYILQNPEKAHICSTEKYLWSSYKEFESNILGLTDTDFALSIFHGQLRLLDFVKMSSNDNCLEANLQRITDAEAISILKKKLHIESGTIIKSFSKSKRDAAIMKLIASGLAMRQIERLTGISRNVISRVAKSDKRTVPGAPLATPKYSCWTMPQLSVK